MSASFRDYEWTGEYEPLTVEDWWCPSEQRWSMCPGECPDGTPHGPSRRVVVQSKLMRRAAVRPEGDT